jgi:hypothetical protein
VKPCPVKELIRSKRDKDELREEVINQERQKIQNKEKKNNGVQP